MQAGKEKDEKKEERETTVGEGGVPSWTHLADCAKE
jgi:hypothetical protein